MAEKNGSNNELIRVVCPGCGRKHKPVPTTYRGRKGRCPACKTVFVIDHVPRLVRLGENVRAIEETVYAPSPKPAPDKADPEATRLAASTQPAQDPEATRLATPPRPAIDPEATRLATPPQPGQDPDATRLAPSPEPAADPDATRIATTPKPEEDPHATHLAAPPQPEPDATRLATPQQQPAAPPSAPGKTYPASAPQTQAAAHAEDDNLPLSWNPGDLLLNTYRVDRILGQGAFGTVYQVRHLEWGVDMAVKTPNPEALDTHGAEIFTSEARTWSELGLHPHIVSCYYVRTLGGAPRAFAEYVDGGSLQELIEAGGVDDIAKKLDIAIQFAWGLAYAHAQNLVHQDVKPANLMLAADGRAKVTDFGLTRAKGPQGPGQEIDAGGGRTVLVDGSGCTPAYAAPEQLAGGQVSRAADAWSFGVSILAMFTGGARWRVGPAAPVILEELPSDGPRMPGELARLLRELFVIEPERRLRDMSQVAQRLMAIYKQETGEEYPRTPPRQGQALAADSLNNRALSQLDLENREQAVALLEEAIKLQPHHPEATYNLGLLRWREGEITDMELVRRLEEVRQTHTATWTDELALGLVHMERGDHAAAVTILEAIDNEEGRNSPMVREALRKVQDLEAPTAPSNLEWEKYDPKTPKHIYFRACFSQDGRILVAPITDKPHAEVYDAQQGTLISRLEGHSNNVLTVALSLDGSQALTGDADLVVKLWNTADGACLQTFTHGTKLNDNRYSGIHALLLDPTAPRAFSGGEDRTVKVWDTETGACLQTLEGGQSKITALQASPGANLLATGDLSGQVMLWRLDTLVHLKTINSAPFNLQCLHFTPDERYLLMGGDKTLQIHDLAEGRELCNRQTGRFPVTAIACSDDGACAATGGHSTPLRLWSVPHGRCLRTFLLQKGPPTVERSVFAACFLQKEQLQALEFSAYIGTLSQRTWPFAPLPAPWLLCRVSESETVSQAASRFDAALHKAQEAFDSAEYATALEHLNKARKQPGHERDPVALDLARKLSRRLPRRTLAGGWQLAQIKAHAGQAHALAVSPDGQYIISAGRPDFSGSPGAQSPISIHNAYNWKWQRDLLQRPTNVTHLAVSADGTRLVSLYQQQSITVWDLESCEILVNMEGKPPNYVSSIFLDPTGRIVFGTVNNAQKQQHHVRFWALESGKHLGLFQGGKTPVVSACASRDGRLFAYYFLNGDIFVRNIGKGIVETLLHPERVRPRNLFFMPGAETLAMFGDGQAVILDLKEKKQLARCSIKTLYDGVAVCTPDFRFMLVGGNQVVTLIDLQTMTELRTFEGHNTTVTSLAVSPDCDWFVSGDYGGTLRVWALDWELEPRQTSDWDDGARSWLQDFLTLKRMPATPWPTDRAPDEEEVKRAFTPSGKPQWNEADFQNLLMTLQRAGYGWLRPEGVRSKLEELAAGS